MEWGGAGLALGRKASSLTRMQTEYCSVNLNGGETEAQEEAVTCLHSILGVLFLCPPDTPNDRLYYLPGRAEVTPGLVPSCSPGLVPNCCGHVDGLCSSFIFRA